MSREPRGVTGHKFVASTEPYLKNQLQPGASSTAVAAAALQHSQNQQLVSPTTSSFSAVSSGVIQTVNSARQFDQIQNKRLKPLPPDANREILKTYNDQLHLYQLDDMVYFSCAKCRKVNVRSDLLAVNHSANQFMCSRCFTKLIRPRNFRPTRLVPFPSLLSWLNYQKPPIFDPTTPSSMGTTADKVSHRFAEAVVPTGDRLATGLAVNGFVNKDLRALPSSAMVSTISSNDVYGQQALADLNSFHPCERIWGRDKCAHGKELCAFAKAPYSQAIEYLMGIATREQCLADGLIVDDVFGLPHKSDLIPTAAYEVQSGAVESGLSSSSSPSSTASGSRLVASSPSDILKPATPLGQWFIRRSKSLIQPEWQLFHNGDIIPIIERFVAFEKVQLEAREAAIEGGTEVRAERQETGGDDNAFIEDSAAGDTHNQVAEPAGDDHAAAGDDDDLGALIDML